MNRIVPREDIDPLSSVTTLSQAIDAYWSARSCREEQAAYHEILLFGGYDRYAPHGRFKSLVIWKIRVLADWLDRE